LYAFLSSVSFFTSGYPSNPPLPTDPPEPFSLRLFLLLPGCLVENYQTPDVRSNPLSEHFLLLLCSEFMTDFLSLPRTFAFLAFSFLDVQGINIPEVLQPYMQGRTFLPWLKPLPKDSTSNKKDAFKKPSN
jgi:hypothetical protein